MTTTPTPRLEHVLSDAFTAFMRDVHVGMPGRVESYDAATQTADVQPLVDRPDTDEAGDPTTETLEVITRVPVVFAGGGGYSETFPLAAGDTVWLAFASCSLDRWSARGDKVDPEDERRFHLSDAVAYAGLRAPAKPRTSAPTDRARFGKDGGVALEVTATEVLVGGGAGHEPTHKATTYDTAFDILIAAIGTAVGGIPGGAGAGTAIATALTTFQGSRAPAITIAAKVR